MAMKKNVHVILVALLCSHLYSEELKVNNEECHSALDAESIKNNLNVIANKMKCNEAIS